jgi:hypothetical protein
MSVVLFVPSMCARIRPSACESIFHSKDIMMVIRALSHLVLAIAVLWICMIIPYNLLIFFVLLMSFALFG